jgi:hypothetical protein
MSGSNIASLGKRLVLPGTRRRTSEFYLWEETNEQPKEDNSGYDCHRLAPVPSYPAITEPKPRVAG